MDFKEFYRWAYKYFGLDLNAYKQAQLTRRIENLMNRVGAKNLREYINILENDKEEKQKFLDFITINVTEFFRNPNLFEELENLLKKEYFSKDKSINIWSAACSIGCEPYSIAMILKENNIKNYNIIATDIDQTILAKAKEGIYSDLEIKNMDGKYLKYFTKKDNKYFLSDEIKRMVKFEKADLILDNYRKNFDLILCRNVVIYFNTETKNRIYKEFNKSLNERGLLFIGATECIYNANELGFRKNSTFIYRKV